MCWVSKLVDKYNYVFKYDYKNKKKPLTDVLENLGMREEAAFQ